MRGIKSKGAKIQAKNVDEIWDEFDVPDIFN